MPIRQRNLNKRQALGANAQAWLRGDRENCSVFFRLKPNDELEALWKEYGDKEAMYLLIPLDVAHDSGMISPTVPI
jgi:hypothetical protein